MAASSNNINYKKNKKKLAPRFAYDYVLYLDFRKKSKQFCKENCAKIVNQHDDHAEHFLAYLFICP